MLAALPKSSSVGRAGMEGEAIDPSPKVTQSRKLLIQEPVSPDTQHTTSQEAVPAYQRPHELYPKCQCVFGSNPAS
jgi:hypothetical protein